MIRHNFSSNAIRALKTHKLLFFITMLVVAGCATAPSPPLTKDSRSGIPPVENQIPTEYEKTSASQPQRPDWIDNTPDDAEQLHFIVGLSQMHASERDAREEAMRNAREAYAKFTGVDVAVVDEVIKTMYGKSSEILDSVVAQKSVAKQATDSQVSRIKAKQWYSEQYKAFRRGEFRGDVYKCWVLVTIPIDEFERVQAWKRKQEESRLKLQADKENRAELALQSVLKRSTESLVRAKSEATAGNIVQALEIIQQEWSQLHSEIDRFSAADECHVARVNELIRMQKELIGEIGNIRSAIYLDKGRFDPQIVDATTGTVTIWAWSRFGPSATPIKGITLTLMSPAGAVLSQAVTDLGGRADFHSNGLSPGRYRVGIETESGSLSLLDKAVIGAISRVETHITLAEPDVSFNGVVCHGVRKLFDGPILAPLPMQKVIMGSATFEDTQQGSDFASELLQIIRQQITTVPGLVVLEPRKRDAAVISEAVKTRGIGLSVAEKGQPSLGSAAMQAVIDGAQAALEVRYAVHADDISVEMNLKEAGSDILLRATTVTIAKESIPNGIDLKPKTMQYPARQVQTANAIKLEVFSHLGDGQTYKEGEKISYFVNINSDAYLLLVYEDAEHNLIQIIPNKYSGKGFYKAGTLLEVPAPGGPFEFVVQAPFGLERLWAFACNNPFPKLQGNELNDGLIVLQETMDSLLTRLRNHGMNPKNQYGEASTIITTRAK